MVKKQVFFYIALILLGLLPHWVHAAQVQAVPDRTRIGSGESLTVELRIEGDVDKEPDLRVLEKDWDVLGQSQSSQVQMINGRFSKSSKYSLNLMPQREGTLTIPPICCGSVCSAARTIEVAPATTGPTEQEGGELLLEAAIEPLQAVSQQQLVLKVRLLSRVDLLKGSLSEPEPQGIEAVVRQLGKDIRYETRRSGYLYQVIERSYAIFPQAAGKLEIPPMRFEGLVSRGSSRFDPFGRQGKRIRRYAQPLEVELSAPPADIGKRPWLPTRDLRFDDDWQGKKLKLTVGEPATRTLTVIAEGLQSAQLPDMRFAVPAGFKNYPDQPVRDETVSPTGITGTLQQKIALVPTRPGHYQLPAMDMDWWDIASKSWRKAHLDAVDIEVAPAPQSAVSAPPSAPVRKKTAPQPRTTPAEVPAVSGPVQTHTFRDAGFWPWLSLALGIAWVATLLLLWGHCAPKKISPDGTITDERPLRQKEARKEVIRIARGNDPKVTREALAAWSTTLWPNDQAAGLQLLMKNAPEPLRKEIEALNSVLYSPGKNIWTGEALIEALENWRPEKIKKDSADALPGLYPSASSAESVVSER